MKAAYYLFISWGSFIEMARQGARRSGGAYLCKLVSEDRVITRPSWQRVPTIAPHNMLISHLRLPQSHIWVFKYFAHNQQSTMKIKIVRSTARYSWWQHWGLGHCRLMMVGEVRLGDQTPGGIINCLPADYHTLVPGWPHHTGRGETERHRRIIRWVVSMHFHFGCQR